MGVAVIVAIAYEDTIRTMHSMQTIFKFSLFHFRSGTLYLEILRLIYFTKKKKNIFNTLFLNLSF